MGKLIDLTGKKFGRWTALSHIDKSRWRVQCECGTVAERGGVHLRNGHSRSCGCLQREAARGNAKELAGQRFGKLVVVSKAGRTNDRSVLWLARCDCGTEKIVNGGSLRAGRATCCGCAYWETRRTRRIDLVGQRFGRLVVASEAENDGTRTRWNCTCDCGKSVVVATQQLRSGKTVSCKCFHREVVSAMFRKESPGYAAAHHRVWGLRGHAKTHSCVDCGSRAHHWSYDGLDPDELIGDVGGQFLAYSLKPDHYAPRCRSCHAVYDHSTARPRDKSGRFASMQEEAS